MKKPTFNPFFLVLALALFSLSYSPVPENMKVSFSLYPNEHKLKELSHNINLNDINEVFRLVFSSLDDQVDVYPTENYYYFVFYANGKEIWGNIRLPRVLRDQGKISFAYWEYDNFPQQMDDPNFFTKSAFLGLEHNIRVTCVAPLDYKVEYENKAVIFKLNRIEQKFPDFVNLRINERFLMRTFDESGLRFYLLFNDKTDDFLYILDEQEGVNESFIRIEENYLYGKRTQFVFYDDKKNYRKILVAVYAENIKENNYYDGPFDQLADNYITEETGLKNCIDKTYPYAEGRVNDFGEFLGQDGNIAEVRLAITPYFNYTSMDDLLYFIRLCEAEKGDKFYSTLVYDYKKDIPR